MSRAVTATSRRARYREQGFVTLGPVLDDAGVAALRAEEKRFRLAHPYAADPDGTLFVNIQLCHRSEVVRRFCTAGPQIEAVVELMGPDVCLTHQQFVTKLPERDASTSEIPMHQDAGYGNIEPRSDVTVWVALVDSDEHNGGLFIVPGSHTLGLLEHGGASVNPLLFEAKGAGEAVCVPLAAGEAVAFSGLTVHGSGPNRSSRERPAFYVRYCEPGALMGDARTPVLEDPHSWVVAGEAR